MFGLRFRAGADVAFQNLIGPHADRLGIRLARTDAFLVGDIFTPLMHDLNKQRLCNFCPSKMKC